MPYGTTVRRLAGAAPTVGTFLLVALAVPIVGEVIRQIGSPAGQSSRVRRPDGRSDLWGDQWAFVLLLRHFGRHWDLLTGGLQGSDPGLWVSLIFLEGFVKPMIIGTASGIAVAEFSGLGRGYDGFTPRYFRGSARPFWPTAPIRPVPTCSPLWATRRSA